MTLAQLAKCLPHATQANLSLYGPKLILAMLEYAIDTPRRQSAFIAQIAHESGSLKYTEEIATGEAYEGRKDLGNVLPGDGVRFKGRGLMQITGRTNYAMLSKELRYDFIESPESLSKPGPACFSAAWFWFAHHLNRLADIDAFDKITRVINGGMTHYPERLAAYEIAKKVLGVETKDFDSPKNIAT
jgi:putative chitinase